MGYGLHTEARHWDQPPFAEQLLQHQEGEVLSR